MSDKNNSFCFNKEEKAGVSLVYQDEKFSFFLKAVVLCFLCVGTGSWLTSHISNKKSHREIQSVRNPSTAIQTTALNPLLIRLKTEKGFQLTKLAIAFEANDSKVLKEISQSRQQVRDHLVFILSNQNTSVFEDVKQRQQLEEEIVSQLNLFLVTGEIQKINITDTTLY